MSDPEPSGAVTPAAETASTPSPPPSPTQPSSTFSNNRGSGLARGKRPVSPPAQTVSAAPAADYKPTAVSILTAPTEYKNPFAPPAPAPAAAASVEASPPAPAPVPAPAAPVTAVPAPLAAPAAEVPPVSRETAQTGPDEGEPKAELKILPPEATKHVEHNWESDSFRSVASQAQPSSEPGRTADIPPPGPRPRRDDRRNERPYFRSERERREDRPAEPRPPWNEPAPISGGEQGRPEAAPAPKTEAPKKSGGWFGWLKKLFGPSSGEAPKPEIDTRDDREFGREGYHRHRRRGGRGRHFHSDQRGARDGQGGGQSSGESRGYGGEHRNHGGRRRRRHHGGGDYRGGGRPEGGPPPGS